VEFLDAADTEWSLMWQHLSQDPINEGDAACVYQNTAWQYMGSTQDHHHFKHQLHPFTLKPEYRYIERRCAGVKWRNIMC